MTHRHQTTRTRAGGVVQAGLDRQGRYDDPPLTPHAHPMRAIVIHTYVTDDGNNRSKFAVECDVVLIRSGVPLPRVRVAQRAHGVNNVHDLWIPKPSTALVTGEDLSLQGGSGNRPSLYRDMNGDHVYVQFVEGDIDRPLITHASTHESTKRLVTGLITDTDASLGWKETDPRRGSPRRNEMYTRHAGTEIRVNGAGDLVLDSVGATTDEINETPSNDAGQIRVRVKNSQRFTVEMDGTDVLEVWKDGGQIRIDLGEGAGQRLILGDDFKTFLNNFLSTKFDLHTHNGGGLTSSDGGVTITGSTTPPVGFTGTQMDDTLLSDLAKTKKS